ncbi:MAG: tRNA (adenosine(37)-N6)-threonylcarbamoyltransferase complex dimerization subunit type 1 TsaB [Candidatus Aminicenantes bacterium]|nr:tRNA (adenosine(37)-N6)-threonylcarbamoyltransferase complex dimerization subunit type 1 TsaB [Candidatus Aminicenantes bacterium]
MHILSIDTTTPCGSVALMQGTRLLTEWNSESRLAHSERLLPAVDFILKSQGVSISDVGAFAVAIGPGSFTGIRIGLSLMKSFAFASGKPIAPVSTLEALALKLMHYQSRLICPLLDARKGELYAALFERRKNELIEIVPQGAYTPDRLLSLLPTHRIISFIGSGTDAFKDKIFDYLKDKARFSTRSLFLAFEVGLLGYRILKEGRGLDFKEVKPLYFRKSQAEEKH